MWSSRRSCRGGRGGEEDEIFFHSEKSYRSRLNGCRDKRGTYIYPDWLVPVGKPGLKLVGNRD